MIEGSDLELFRRSIDHATANHSGAALDARLAELGWPEALAEDPHTAVSVLFASQGAANTTSSALHQVLAHALGRTGVPVILPPIGESTAPGVPVGPTTSVQGLTLGRQPTVLVVTRTGDSVVASTLSAQPVRGVDPALELFALAGDVAGPTSAEPAAWLDAVALGRLALAHELVGASRTMLALARQHALDRIQFGQPIARYQAVRHRLAETLVAIEAADAMVEAAWLDLTPPAAALAKAVAGRGARVAARHCQQVLAGIGFTTEHPLHRFVRRVLVLEQLLGSTQVVTQELGRDAVVHKRLPALLPL
jgi:Acyl-CoA dehydrogenase, C-terminal domain